MSTDAERLSRLTHWAEQGGISIELSGDVLRLVDDRRRELLCLDPVGDIRVGSDFVISDRDDVAAPEGPSELDHPLWPEVFLLQQALFSGLRLTFGCEKIVVLESPRRMAWPESDEVLATPIPHEWDGWPLFADPVFTRGTLGLGCAPTAMLVDLPPILGVVESLVRRPGPSAAQLARLDDELRNLATRQGIELDDLVAPVQAWRARRGEGDCGYIELDLHVGRPHLTFHSPAASKRVAVKLDWSLGEYALRSTRKTAQAFEHVLCEPAGMPVLVRQTWTAEPTSLRDQ